jgi:hypothetical protein
MGFVLRPNNSNLQSHPMGRSTTDLGKHVASSYHAFYLYIPITAHVLRTASNHRLVGYVFNARSWLVVVIDTHCFFLLRQKLVKCLVVSVQNVKKGYINVTFSNINATLYSDLRVLHRESNQRPHDPLPPDWAGGGFDEIHDIFFFYIYPGRPSIKCDITVNLFCIRLH